MDQALQAIRTKNTPLLQSLLDRQNLNLTLLLIEAVKRNNLQAAQLLLERGENPNNNVPVEHRGRLRHAIDLDILITLDNMPPLFTAVNNGNIEMVLLLLQYGADVNVTMADKTVLGTAIMNNNIEMTKLLLENGANPNIKNEDFTPIVLAIRQGNLKIVNELLKSPTLREDQFTIEYAVRKGETEIVQTLIDHNFEIGPTLLGIAVQSGQADVVDVLLAAGVDIGDSLSSAIYRNNRYMVEKLLNAGANPDEFETTQNYQNRPLEAAINNFDDIEIIKLLIAYGANIYHTNNKGNNIFLMAALEGQIENIFDILLDLGLQLNTYDEIVAASLSANPHFFNRLLQQDFNVNITNPATGASLLFDLKNFRLNKERLDALVELGAIEIRPTVIAPDRVIDLNRAYDDDNIDALY